jgi:hypothetical protein
MVWESVAAAYYWYSSPVTLFRLSWRLGGMGTRCARFDMRSPSSPMVSLPKVELQVRAYYYRGTCTPKL